MYSKNISTIPVTWVQYLTTMRQTTHIGMPQAYPTKLLKYEGERNVNTYCAWNGTCQPWWPLMTLLHWYPIIPLKSPQLAWRRSVRDQMFKIYRYNRLCYSNMIGYLYSSSDNGHQVTWPIERQYNERIEEAPCKVKPLVFQTNP